jgi:PAS domain S-box-containing protein
MASAPIGLGGKATIVAGAARPGFPNGPQRLLLTTAANQVTIALQRWQFEAEERRLAALIESSSDLIGFVNLEGVPQYINPAGLKLAGLPTIEDASRLHILDFIVPEEQAHARDHIFPVLLHVGRWIGELNFRNFETGETVPVLVDCFRIDDPRTGQPMNFGTVTSNLSAQKKSEGHLRCLNESLEHRVSERTCELKRANDALVVQNLERERADARAQELQFELFHASRLSTAGQLAAALAHELYQPLTASINSINAARRLSSQAGSQAKACVALEEAAEQAVRASHIMRRLSDFVRRGRSEKRSESVIRIVEDAATLALTGPDSPGVVLQLKFDRKVEYVFADRIQIEQVLVNLMRNAIDAMANGTRRELGVSTTLLDDETVEISVTDTGPGIPQEIQAQLFEPFVSTKSHGMGLGLSICRSVVEAHGGRLQAGTSSGGGAVFRFTLANAAADRADDGR